MVMLENSNTDSHVLMLDIEEYCLVDFLTQNGYIRFPVASLNAIFMELKLESPQKCTCIAVTHSFIQS